MELYALTFTDEKSHMNRKKDVMSISFGIRGNKLVPGYISELLKLSPTKAWQKGDSYRSRYQKDDGSIDFQLVERAFGIWELSSSPTVVSDNIKDHALYIINQLDSAAEQIRDLIQRDDLRVSVSIWWQPKDGYGGYTLPADSIRKLSMVCAEMDFYFG